MHEIRFILRSQICMNYDLFQISIIQPVGSMSPTVAHQVTTLNSTYNNRISQTYAPTSHSIEQELKVLCKKKYFAALTGKVNPKHCPTLNDCC